MDRHPGVIEALGHFIRLQIPLEFVNARDDDISCDSVSCQQVADGLQPLSPLRLWTRHRFATRCSIGAATRTVRECRPH